MTDERRASQNQRDLEPRISAAPGKRRGYKARGRSVTELPIPPDAIEDDAIESEPRVDSDAEQQGDSE